MKISFLEPHLKIYGGIRRIVEISNRLVMRGYDVSIFHSDGSPCEWMEGLAETKPLHEVLSVEHDVLIYNDPTKRDYTLAKKAKAKLKIFFVLELYKTKLLKGFHPSIFMPWNRRTRYVKKSLSRDYLIICNATWEAEWLKNRLGIDSELLIGGLNTDVFHPVTVQKKNRKKTILFSGDVRPRKGTTIIKKALKRVRSQISNLNEITYHGKGIPQHEMAAIYSSADIFVDASYHAGWNNPVIEAMACMTPVVCTDIGGVHDFAVHEQTALIVAPGDYRAMADAIVRLIKEPELAKSLKRKAYEKATQFLWKDAIDRMEKVLIREFKKKSFNPSYVVERDYIIPLIPKSSQLILDVGCSAGMLGKMIKKWIPMCKLCGIEIDPNMADKAKKYFDQIVVGDIEQLDYNLHFSDQKFDAIIFADVLEHLRDPWKILKKTSKMLRQSGIIIIGLPNIGHYSTIFNLAFRDYWPYRERGIHDKTHLRFFTLKTIMDLLDFAGLEVVKIQRRYRVVESMGMGPLNRISWIFTLPVIRRFFTFQFLIVAKKVEQ